MKLFDTEGQEGRLEKVVQMYADIVRAGIRLIAWTFIAVVSLAAAFVAGRLAWSLFTLALRLIGRI